MEKRNSTKRLTESALLLAIAVVLELVSKLLGLELPFGGTITLASMFPVVLISYRYGVKWVTQRLYLFAFADDNGC